MKRILIALFLLTSIAQAQDNISQSTGIIGNGRFLGAKTVDNQTTVPVLGVNSTGNTEIGTLSGKGVDLPALIETLSTTAGAGTTVADAGQLSATAYVHRVTGANGTVGVKFSSSTPIGSIQIILNTTAGVLKIYGETGSTVNGGSANAAFSALTGIKPIICIKTAALTYICA